MPGVAGPITPGITAGVRTEPARSRGPLVWSSPMTPDAASMAEFGGPPDVSLLQAAITAGISIFVILSIGSILAIHSLPIFNLALYKTELGLKAIQNLPDPICKYSKIGGLVFRSKRRNMLRTSLTYAAQFVLTYMLTLIY